METYKELKDSGKIVSLEKGKVSTRGMQIYVYKTTGGKEMNVTMEQIDNRIADLNLHSGEHTNDPEYTDKFLSSNTELKSDCLAL